MEAGGGFLQINKMSSSIKPGYQLVLLPLLLPASWCGMVPSPIKSSRGGGVDSCNGVGGGVWHLTDWSRIVRLAARRLDRWQRRRRHEPTHGVGAWHVPGEPAHLGFLPGAVQEAGVHGGRRRLLRGATDLRRRPRLGSDIKRSFRALRSCPKAGEPTTAEDGAIATTNPIDDLICRRKQDKAMAEIEMKKCDDPRSRASASLAVNAFVALHLCGAHILSCRAHHGIVAAHELAVLGLGGAAGPPHMWSGARQCNVHFMHETLLALFASTTSVGPSTATWSRPWQDGVHAAGLCVWHDHNTATRASVDRDDVWFLGQIQYSCCVLSFLQLLVLLELDSNFSGVRSTILPPLGFSGFRYEHLLSPTTTTTSSFSCRHVSSSKAPSTHSSPSLCAVSPFGCMRL